jgi:hypothetical protein
MKRLAAAVLLIAAACASPDAHVARTGFTRRGALVGTGAIVRTNSPMRDIEVTATFFAKSRKVRAERDRLPFCPAHTDCLWGQQLFTESVGTVDRVEVTVTGARRAKSVPEPRRLRVRTRRTETIVEPDGTEGTVYLVAIDVGVPKLGRSSFVRRGERVPLHFSPALFPIREGERVVAFLYPGRVPARVEGAAD